MLSCAAYIQTIPDKLMGTYAYTQIDRCYRADWLQQLLGNSDRADTPGNRYRELLLLIPFMLLVFALTTPFDFSWPQEVKNRENIIDVTEAVHRMEHGNMGRRAGLVLLGVYGIAMLGATQNRFRVNSPEGVLAITYMAWVLLSLTWSIDTMFTLRRVVTIYLMWVAALATAARYSIREIAILAAGVCGITAVLAFGNELRLHTIEPSNHLWRFSGLFHTVAMGWNCGLLALSSAYLATVTKNRCIKRFMYLTLTMAMCLLLLTKSRMALAATLGGLCFFWMMASSRKNKAGIILGIISLGCLCYLLIGDQIVQYLDAASTLGRGQEAKESVGDLTGRIPLWKECFKWAAMRPLVGYGFNTFISPKHYAAIVLHVGWAPSSTHSAYIDAIMGLGYIGFLFLTSFLITTSFRAVMLARRFLSYNFLAAVMIWLCYNLFLEAHLITRPTFMTFIALTVLAHFAFMPEEEAATT